MSDNPHYVTPKEATERVCPMSVQQSKGTCCFGPNCMAWRWEKDAPMRYKGDGNPQPTDRAKGYCGMVGE